MSYRTTISLPEELRPRIRRHKRNIDMSAICARALKKELDELDTHRLALKRFVEEHPSHELVSDIQALLDEPVPS